MKKLTIAVLAAATMLLVNGCVCDGTEMSFREIDRKYADSAWTAAATFIPILGPLFIGVPLIIHKNSDYYRVLLRQPESEAFEVLRYQYRSNIMYYPRELWR